MAQDTDFHAAGWLEGKDMVNMAEKLYKCHCIVPGHGTKCEVAHDKKKSKKELSKLRRRLYKNYLRLGIHKNDNLW